MHLSQQLSSRLAICLTWSHLSRHGTCCCLSPLFAKCGRMVLAKVVQLLQARAGGGRLPQLYEAKVHLRLRLGIVSRLLFLVSQCLSGFVLLRMCICCY